MRQDSGEESVTVVIKKMEVSRKARGEHEMILHELFRARSLGKRVLTGNGGWGATTEEKEGVGVGFAFRDRGRFICSRRTTVFGGKMVNNPPAPPWKERGGWHVETEKEGGYEIPPEALLHWVQARLGPYKCSLCSEQANRSATAKPLRHGNWRRSLTNSSLTRVGDVGYKWRTDPSPVVTRDQPTTADCVADWSPQYRYNGTCGHKRQPTCRNAVYQSAPAAQPIGKISQNAVANEKSGLFHSVMRPIKEWVRGHQNKRHAISSLCTGSLIDKQRLRDRKNINIEVKQPISCKSHKNGIVIVESAADWQLGYSALIGERLSNISVICGAIFLARVSEVRDMSDYFPSVVPTSVPEPQMFVHWLLPQRVASVTSHLAVRDSLIASLEVSYWLAVMQSVSNKLRSNCNAVNLLASRQGEPGSIPGRVKLPDFRMWESCRTIPLVGGFSRGSPVPPSFPSNAAPYSPQSLSSALKTPVYALTPLQQQDRGSNQPTLVLRLAMTWSYFGQPLKTEIRMNGPGIEHESSGMQVGIVRTPPLVSGFSRGSPISPTPAFRRCSILTSLHTLSVELVIFHEKNMSTG
ncbi:hypothetical protein PR048_014123 [Dryococelus australis]|uniref:Uncharacterized protein n=1 Tax=Dryococelus australis TaxID=614101 RepID=A0ABQ9HDQ5_9NEOP|nr:hypothetical protein PR048_014123 [Dryococelus australis]